MAEVLTVLTLCAGGIAAVWAVLSRRIAALEEQIKLLMEQNINVLKENSTLTAQRDLYAERRADLAQRIQVVQLERDRLWGWLERALDIRTQLSELQAIRQKADEMFEPKEADDAQS